MLISVQEAKASRKFGVLRSFRYESNRNRLLYKTVSGNFEIFIPKSLWPESR